MEQKCYSTIKKILEWGVMIRQQKIKDALYQLYPIPNHGMSPRKASVKVQRNRVEHLLPIRQSSHRHHSIGLILHPTSSLGKRNWEDIGSPDTLLEGEVGNYNVHAH
jgi:hypothetical protein